MARFAALVTSPERTETVVEEIRVGSEPKASFYALLMSAAMIACFGLVANSTAVIIGAMLVSPLMTPIFGIALGMLRGDGNLFWRALGAEVFGALLAIGAAYLFGLLPVLVEATPEMLARTEPNLIDLMVAVVAGFAGAYALLDVRISPALPGVAIATAIVPPLSTTGLCLAMGAYDGAFGSLLLFIANFVAILLVAVVTFTAAGMAPSIKSLSLRGLLRRFGWAVLGFAVVTFVLTHSLIRIMDDRALAKGIHTGLTAQLLATDGSALDEFVHHVHRGRLQILATVRSPRMFSPNRVKSIQDRLSEQLGKPTDLVVRTVLAKDVVATGSDLEAGAIDLNGLFLSHGLSETEKVVRTVEQVLFEQLQAEPGFRLVDVELGGLREKTKFVLATLQTVRIFSDEEIRQLEDRVRAKLGDPQIVLMLRFMSTTLVSRWGPFLVEWSRAEATDDETRDALTEIGQVIRQELAKLPEVFPSDVHLHREEKLLRMLAEVSGPRVPSPAEAAAVQQAVAQQCPWPIEMNIWYKGDTVVTTSGYTSFQELTKPTLQRRMEDLPETFEGAAQR